jgi:uncharacterized membrane protein
MSFIQQPAYLLAVLCCMAVFAEWLSGRRYFKMAGPVIIVILLGAILANLGVIPSAHNAPPLYGGIFEYAAPLAVFFLLLEVRLKDLRLAGLPMIGMFLVGTMATVSGVLAGFWIFQPGNHMPLSHAVAGMYTGTYIGGSVNLNAVALQYSVNEEGTLFAAINAVDNLVGTPWMLATILLPPLLRRVIPRKKTTPPEMNDLSDEAIREMTSHVAARFSVTDFAALLALGFGAIFLSSLVSSVFPRVPAILTITTIALSLAQTRFVQRLKGSKMLGMFLIMIFLSVVGAFCDVQAVLNSGSAAGILVAWVLTIILLHGLIIFTVGGLLRLDWDIVSIASNANIGGSTSAPVCAAALGRPDLQLPGLLAGSLGNAIGTYIALFIAELLK